mmetsp:Transcript_47193/g.148139  ORF Transcript_47193/g.148139 Transcript_47193/m.148139 type:complete len:221 (-) Transcript_47193:79-741(-)
MQRHRVLRCRRSQSRWRRRSPCSQPWALGACDARRRAQRGRLLRRCCEQGVTRLRAPPRHAPARGPRRRSCCPGGFRRHRGSAPERCGKPSPRVLPMGAWPRQAEATTPMMMSACPLGTTASTAGAKATSRPTVSRISRRWPTRWLGASRRAGVPEACDEVNFEPSPACLQACGPASLRPLDGRPPACWGVRLSACLPACLPARPSACRPAGRPASLPVG